MERFSAVIFLQLCIYSITCSAHVNSTYEGDTRHNSTDGTHLEVSQDQEITTENNSRKINVTVYYETLCPASINFFIRQLRPAAQVFGEHMNVHLVPYGHAKMRKSGRRYVFKCQHGYPECYGNRLHACAIDVIRNNTLTVLFTACLIESFYRSATNNYNQVLNSCASTLHVPRQDIAVCMHNDHGFELLKSYGEETHLVDPRFVPYVLLDNSTEHQRRAVTNLKETICNKLVKHTPHDCSKNLSGRA